MIHYKTEDPEGKAGIGELRLSDPRSHLWLSLGLMMTQRVSELQLRIVPFTKSASRASSVGPLDPWHPVDARRLKRITFELLKIPENGLAPERVSYGESSFMVVVTSRFPLGQL